MFENTKILRHSICEAVFSTSAGCSDWAMIKSRGWQPKGQTQLLYVGPTKNAFHIFNWEKISK